MVAILFGIKIYRLKFGSLEISSCVPAVARERQSRARIFASENNMKSALTKKYSLDYLDNYQKSIIFVL